MLDATAAMGTPVFILSGGDPVKRPDLCTLVRHGKWLGLRMGTIPAATPALTDDLVRELKDAGLDQMALSLDFPRADLHDAFRGVPGAFARTMRAAEWAHGHELPLQINTTLCGALGSVHRGDGRSSSNGWGSSSGRCSSWCRSGAAKTWAASRRSSARRCSRSSTASRSARRSWSR